MDALVVLHNLTHLEVREYRVARTLRCQANAVTFVWALVVGALKRSKRRIKSLGHVAMCAGDASFQQVNPIAARNRIATLKDATQVGCRQAVREDLK